MVYVIFHQIRSIEKTDYTKLYDKIKSIGTWMNYFNTAWFLEPDSSISASEIYDMLIPFIDGDWDYLYIVELNLNESRGWMPEKAWEWLKNR